MAHGGRRGTAAAESIENYIPDARYVCVCGICVPVRVHPRLNIKHIRSHTHVCHTYHSTYTHAFILFCAASITANNFTCLCRI